MAALSELQDMIGWDLHVGSAMFPVYPGQHFSFRTVPEEDRFAKREKLYKWLDSVLTKASPKIRARRNDQNSSNYCLSADESKTNSQVL